MPIWPTIWAASVMSSSVSAGMPSKLVTLPDRSASSSKGRGMSARITAMRKRRPVGAGDVAHHRQRGVQMRAGAGRSGGADDQRHVQRTGGEQHAAQVAAGSLGRRRHLALAQIGRTDVDRAHVAADQVGLALHAGVEGGGGDAVAELARRPQQADGAAASGGFRR